MAAKFEIRPTGTGQFTWVLVSQGRTLATGEPYARRAMAEKAVASLRSAVGGATVADLTAKPKPAAAKATRTAKPAKAATRAAKATKKATGAAKPARVAKKAAAPRKRAPRAS